MKLWGGRFTGETDEMMRRFNDSFHFDRRMFREDIAGSVAYAEALVGAGLLTAEECQSITMGLGQVLTEFESGAFTPAPSDEDIHTAVERRLTEIIGPAGGKLHTGRSRNDQVASDFRLYCMAAIDSIYDVLKKLQKAILTQSERHLGAIMPGYTHRQPAQPILFSHWLMSFFWMFQRDRERFGQTRERTAVSPLGSGALAGNPFLIDRAVLGEELGMPQISVNSIDAVSDRDFAAEFLFDASLLGVHLSRLAEDLILFSSVESGFITLDEAFTTGSSLMPQKRNPDSLELIRGKTGRLIGDLVGLLTMLKALPSAYNKDLQEDKESVFDAHDQLEMMLTVMTGVIETMTLNPTAMRDALTPALLATDMADALVESGLPFREAHVKVGEAIRLAESRGCSLTDLPADALLFDPHFSNWNADKFSFDSSVNRRSSAGGTAETAVKEQIAQARLVIKG